jgi:small-conductance mechanosensitive channel
MLRLKGCNSTPSLRPQRWLVPLLALVLGGALGMRLALAQSPDQLNSDTVLRHLNAIINWYRDITTNVPNSGQPSDAIYRSNAQSLAAEAVRLAFQSAEAEAEIIGTPNKSNAPNPAPPSSAGGQQDFSQMQAKIASTIASTQSQIEQLDHEIARAAGSRRQALVSQRARLRGELELDRAMQDSVQKLAAFESGSENGGLLGNINQLKRSLPEVFSNTAQQKTANPPTNSQPVTANSEGLVGQSLDLYRQIRGMHEIDQLSNETWSVRQIAQDVRKPLHEGLSATQQRGRDLANQAQSSNPSQGESIPQEFEDLTSQFKKLADATVPLAQETVVLDQSRANLYEWRRSVQGAFRTVLQALLVRVVMIAIALGVVLVVSEVWRRFTFRYVRDVRRRRQFLILRRFVTGFLFALVVILGFVSQFSSLATFAGFLTAGIAVSLQAILLSIAAYFFLIGRYGISVGDRISVSGVTGDVVDIGLIRFYVMELAGSGVDLYPTGRLIVLSNSVLFQATTPLFKQIPGTEFTWHEVAVSLAPTGSYKVVQDRLSQAVNSVYSKYREEIERQHQAVSRRMDVPLSVPEPHSQLQFTEAGLELQIRYPVDIRTASQVDDEITRKLVEIITTDATVKDSVSGSPKLRATVKG